LTTVSDVVWVPLITAFASGGAAWIASHAATRGLEASIKAEDRRHAEQAREQERQRRQDAYRNLVVASQEIIGVGFSPDEARHSDVWDQWRVAVAELQLLASKQVMAAARPLLTHVRGVPTEERPPSDWRETFTKLHRALLDAMRTDLGAEPVYDNSSKPN
jgi:hypothetical protein